MTAIVFRDVALGFGTRMVLSEVDLNIGPREFVAVLGANGAGKTLLMRAVLGLVPPRRGSIRVLGRPARRGNPAIGYLPQTRGLSPAARLSGREFLASAVAGHRLGLPLLGRAGRAALGRALDLVGGHELAQRPLAELSGGERQRLLLAEALLGNPSLLLLDEPLTGLDPHHQSEVVRLVATLRRELGIAVLFSAHDLNPLIGAIDRVLYLGRGAAALGTVAEVITGPVLSRLYGTEIEVVRVAGRVFVLAGGQPVEHDAHRHEGAS